MKLSRKLTREQFVKYGYLTERQEAILRLANMDCADLPEREIPIPACEPPERRTWGKAGLWGFLSSISP